MVDRATSLLPAAASTMLVGRICSSAPWSRGNLQGTKTAQPQQKGWASFLGSDEVLP